MDEGPDEPRQNSGNLSPNLFCFRSAAAMTRWARANNVHRNKPAEATPWSQLRGRGSGGGARGDPLRKTQAGGSSAKNRKKKDYTNEDVNGFLEYLKESGAPPPAGRPEHQQEELVQEVEEALKRDTRRENRRVKRQNDKKNKMVRLLLLLHCSQKAASEPAAPPAVVSAALLQLQEARPRPGRLPRGRRRPGHGPGHLLPLRLHRARNPQVQGQGGPGSG